MSDFHLGAKWDTEREDDPFDQARESLEKALEMGAQLILIPGDIFESRTPNQEIWSSAMRLLSTVSEKKNREIELDRLVGKDEDDITALPLRGVPVVAIHGNHERRGKGFVDSIKALESAGLLIRLHHNSIVLEDSEQKIAIHGMGYVPGRYARNLLEEWNPEPVDGAVNLLMIHQGLGRFTFSGESSTLRTSDLPPGFDLYISGHVHYRIESEVHGKPLIFPGSTVRTQLLQIESEVPKGFYMLDIEDGNIDKDFVELETDRGFFYEKKDFDKTNAREIEDWIRERVKEILNHSVDNPEKKPMVRFRLTGTLSKGSSSGDIDVKDIRSDFSDSVLLFVSKEDLSSPDLEEKTQFLKDIRDEKISMEEKGMRVLESNLEDMDYDERFDPRMLFEYLSEDKVDEAYDQVLEKLENLTESVLEEGE